MKLQHTTSSPASIAIFSRRLFMKKYFVLLLACSVALTFSSCKKFLSQTSLNDVADEDMFQDAASLESARIGLYNTLQDQYYYGGYYPLMLDAYSDNGQTGGFDIPALNELGDKTLTSSNIYVESAWISIYNTIYTANKIIANIDGIDDPTLSDELRNDIKGEALAIRAMAHFDLLRMFGEHWDLNSAFGIPVVLTVQEAADIVARSTVAESYDAIISDLNEAESLISNDDNRLDPPSFKGAQYMTKNAVDALLARVYLYEKDYTNAATFATDVINSGFATLLDADNFTTIYTSKLSSESIFELIFNTQDRSQYNALTYSRPDALRTEVLFLTNEDLNFFFTDRPDDLRGTLVDFVNNDLSIEPDGRSQKYRGEDFQDNDAYLIRIAEMYLIRAEASGLAGGGLDDLNVIRTNRGMTELTNYDVPDDETFMNAVQDERRAELNFEGQRYCDLARIGKVQEVLGADVLPVFPIPLREVVASGGVVEQNTGY